MRHIRGFAAFPLMGWLMLLSPTLAVRAHGQAVGFAPIPAPLPSGVILDITPSVSADRRYVRLNVGASFNDILGFTTYSVPAAVGGGGPAGMNGLIGALGGGGGGAAGAGGGAGARSVGLGTPVVATPPPGFEFATSLGDPFQRALQETPSAGTAVPHPTSEINPPLRTRAKSKSARSAPRTARGSQRSPKLRRKPISPREVFPDAPAEFFPYDW
jgi:hypothetical protein